MTGFSDHELAVAHCCIDEALDDIARLGLRLDVDNDMRAWAEHRRTAPGGAALYGPIGPEHAEAGARDCIWMRCVDRAGAVRASIAYRLLVTDDLLAPMRVWRLFYEGEPVAPWRRAEAGTEPGLPVISGRICCAGGLWVHPDHRGTALRSPVGRAGQWLALCHFEGDWLTTFFRGCDRRRAMTSGGIRFHVTPGIRGRFPPRGEEGDYVLGYVSRAEYFSHVQAERDPMPLLAAG